jgi:hypothetical protein
MLDPSTINIVVQGLVTSVVTYLGLRTKKKAESAGGTSLAKSNDGPVQAGEQALHVIERLIETQGSPEAKTALLGFRQNPEAFKDVLCATLVEVARAHPNVGEELSSTHQSVRNGTGVAMAAGNGANAQVNITWAKS